ncbi:UNVERIFIED_CONTAM: hypothetical protein HHA_222075 [Hammondia hammondi]|eukprot:XP_008886223.1 hypothetical protein HHA_222075 [Hammondia hammondi]
MHHQFANQILCVYSFSLGGCTFHGLTAVRRTLSLSLTFASPVGMPSSMIQRKRVGRYRIGCARSVCDREHSSLLTACPNERSFRLLSA